MITWLEDTHSGFGPPQVAFSVGKWVGSAVVRNRVRRRLRAIMADFAGDLSPGCYLVGAGSKSGEAKFDDIRGNIWKALQNLGAIPAGPKPHPHGLKN